MRAAPEKPSPQGEGFRDGSPVGAARPLAAACRHCHGWNPIFQADAALRRAGVSPPYGENRNPSAQRTPQFFIMIIGLNKQLRFFASVRITLSLRASPQTGVAIRFPSRSPFFQKYLENCDILETDCRVARLPRNDSAGRNPVIKIRMLTKTDSHIFHYAFFILHSAGWAVGRVRQACRWGGFLL